MSAASSGEAQPRLKRILAHPLTITFAGAILAAIILPLVTREWQDRQDELQLKRGLVERIAEASTTAVRDGITYIEQELNVAPEGTAVDIGATYRSWLVERAITRAVVATYFRSLDACWYGFSNAITSLLELAQTNKPSVNTGKISDSLIQTDVDCGWSAKVTPAQATRLDDLREKLVHKGVLHAPGARGANQIPLETFRRNFSDIGELLLIGKDGVIGQIVDARARGYYHGIF
jgi:hypothetical protein